MNFQITKLKQKRRAKEYRSIFEKHKVISNLDKINQKILEPDFWNNKSEAQKIFKKKKFLEYGDMWWWESNRQLPIDIFLNHEMKEFIPFLSTFVMKDVEVLFGPMTSLQNLIRKRIKRRGVQLVRKTDQPSQIRFNCTIIARAQP